MTRQRKRFKYEVEVEEEGSKVAPIMIVTLKVISPITKQPILTHANVARVYFPNEDDPYMMLTTKTLSVAHLTGLVESFNKYLKTWKENWNGS